MSEVAASDSAPIAIPAAADMDAAEDLLARLREIGSEGPLTIDASAVESMSTPVVLTIVSALNTRAELKPPATVLNPSTAFVDAFTDLGLFQDLMKMEFAT
ncbi:STAS domain-containing protein [Algicella marina]|uniref:STAS domain-containing protein n=1 Tax=Algicella marina TaxID=2683284 RepID=A0A6P1T8F0_9RHOB|nr:STAS domain-containing protein [Algicella marina]QHQ36882.1 hypothetical protein GO499_17680 [Algicella marina]